MHTGDSDTISEEEGEGNNTTNTGIYQDVDIDLIHSWLDHSGKRIYLFSSLHFAKVKLVQSYTMTTNCTKSFTLRSTIPI